jgi:hypothetical protein
VLDIFWRFGSCFYLAFRWVVFTFTDLALYFYFNINDDGFNLICDLLYQPLDHGSVQVVIDFLLISAIRQQCGLNNFIFIESHHNTTKYFRYDSRLVGQTVVIYRYKLLEVLIYDVIGSAVAHEVRRWRFTAQACIQSGLTSCEIRCGCSRRGAGFPPSVFRFPLLITVPPFLRTHLPFHMRCAINLIKSTLFHLQSLNFGLNLWVGTWIDTKEYV